MAVRVPIAFLLVIPACFGQALVVTAPKDNTAVAERPFVEGTAKNASAIVWVVVHPLETGDFYVQPKVNVRGGGAWTVQVYVGRPGRVDLGKRFEIRAISNPSDALSEGQTLPNWPRAEAMSEVILVTRR